MKVKSIQSGQPVVVAVNADTVLRRLPPEVVSTLARADAQEVIERLPAMGLNELKPGEMILVSSTTGADPSRVTAIILAAGVESLLSGAARAPAARPAQSPGLSIPGLDVVGLGLP